VLAFGLAFVVLLGVGISLCAIYLSQSRLRVKTIAEYDFLVSLNKVRQTITEEQSAQRGYIITGDKLYLSKYDANTDALPEQIAHLDKILPSQNRYLFDRLSHDIYSTQAGLNNTETTIRNSGVTKDEELTLLNSGEASVNLLKESIDKISIQHKHYVLLLSRQRDKLFGTLLVLVSVLILIVFLLCGGAAILVVRKRSARLEIERLRAAQNALLVAQRNEFSQANDRLELAAKRFEALFQSIPVVCIYTDVDGGIMEWNQASERMFGWTRDEALRLTIFETVVPPANVPEARRSLAAVVSGKSMSGAQLACLTKEGHQIDMMAYLIPMLGDDGETIGTLTAMVDITQRKAIERLKSEFVSTVSHELRSPLTSISGALGLICNGATGTLSDEASRLCQIANKNTDRLVRLINDILDVERIDSGHLAFSFVECNVADLARVAIEKERALADASSVSVFLSVGPPDLKVLADSDRIVQAMQNLISNAVKFSPAGCEVTVSVQQADSMVTVSVEDCGSGIPVEFRPRLFDRFAQADGGNTRQRGGSGLGLSICKSIVELHGGTIWFEPCKVGTRFSFQLPLEEDGKVSHHESVSRISGATAVQSKEAL